MTREEIISCAVEFTRNSPANYVAAEVAVKPEYAGMKMFDDPVFAFGAADDEIFAEYKSKNIICEEFMTPDEWLPGAKTVISFFIPITERIRASNAADFDYPSKEWMHARIEGQMFLKELCLHLQKMLTDAGYKTVAPLADDRCRMGKALPNEFSSNWPERHAAFVCGHGTFGLSKGIITEKGMAGRLGSLITELDLPKTERKYKEIYEYCINCGECIKHCPVKCISFEKGKIHKPCSDFLDRMLEENDPRYGCGKCQVKVPCESGRP